LLSSTGIIHCDISKGNLINEDKGNPYWRAFLIDLDLAFKEEHTERCDATRKTGIKVFMSIGALKDNKDKNYGFTDDLESFFGVLFWICVHHTGPNDSGELSSHGWV
jgi:Fungal protein kinase